jgi:hypothetical protein
MKNGIASTLYFLVGFATASYAALPGNGTSDDPYRIYTYNDLDSVRLNLAAFYRLMADIDASPGTLSPIGNGANPFTGTFHGGGHIISNLNINSTLGGQPVGLFGGCQGTIDSLGLPRCTMHGLDFTCALAGAVVEGIISQCYATGLVSGNLYVGGVIGDVTDFSTITTCYSTCNGFASSGVGGLIGYAGFSWISGCYSSGAVSGQGQCNGGLVGYAEETMISSCYATGSVNGREYTGGFIGRGNEEGAMPTARVTMKIRHCYSIGHVIATSSAAGFCGSLVGYGPRIDSCAVDSDRCGQTLAYRLDTDSAICSVAKLSTAAMKQQDILSGSPLGWGFGPWVIRNDSTYPGLDGVDNAPFAFNDTCTTFTEIFPLTELLKNDADLETGQEHLTLRVTDLSGGTTDSISTLTLPDSLTPVTVTYRVGEVRLRDTLWGNLATSVVQWVPSVAVQSALPSKMVWMTITTENGMLQYSLPKDVHVLVRVYDLLGRLVTVSVNERERAGHYSAVLAKRGMSAGIYFVTFQAGEYLQNKKMILIGR